MTKKELAKAIAEEVGLPVGQVQHIVQKAYDGIIESLVQEGRIELRNFGVFTVKERKPRKARNPRTGEAVDVPGRLAVVFKAGKEMEERVGKIGPVASEAIPALLDAANEDEDVSVLAMWALEEIDVADTEPDAEAA